jgi:hypothetical protein
MGFITGVILLVLIGSGMLMAAWGTAAIAEGRWGERLAGLGAVAVGVTLFGWGGGGATTPTAASSPHCSPPSASPSQ